MAHSLAGWQIAVVVLRYFVAVLMLGEWVRTGPAPGSWTRVMRLFLRTTFSVPRKLSPRTWCAIRRAFSFSSLDGCPDVIAVMFCTHLVSV